MATRIGSILLMFTLMGTLGVGAERELSLDEAISIALKQNKDVLIAKLNVDKADAQVREAFGNALPTVNLSASYNRNIQVPVFFIPDFSGNTGEFQAIRAGLNNSYLVGAQATQVLFNSAVFSGIGAAGIYAEGAREQYRAAVAKVVTEVKSRYYGAMAAREFVRIAEATVENARQNYETVSALFKEGLVAEFDQIRASVALENIRPQLTEARAGYNNAVSALSTYLAMDLKDTIRPMVGQLDDIRAIPEEAAAVQLALENNYDLKVLKKQLELLDAVVDVNRSTYYPSLSLIGNWQNQGQSNTYSDWLNASSSFVGLNFQFNIFNGLRTISKVEQARVDYLTMREQYENMKNIVRLQVRTALNDLRSALERIEAQRSTVQQAQRGFEISRIRYTEGTGSLLEINDAEVALARSELNRTQALLDYYTRRAEFDRVVGDVPAQYLQLEEN
jgi:outer membrane protein